MAPALTPPGAPMRSLEAPHKETPMKSFALLSLPLALTLAGCASHAADPGAAPPAAAVEGDTLTAHHWRLSDARDSGGQRLGALLLRPDRPVQLDFRADGGLAVSNTCNRMGGRYEVQGPQLSVGPLASTRMACADPQLMALDAQVGQRLQGTLTAVLDNGTPPRLTLTAANGDRLVFDGEATAETRYGGPGTIMFMEVAAQTQRCAHPLIRDKQCLQVRELAYDAQGLRRGEPGRWQPLYQDIEGYVHTPGVRNVLRLKRYTIANPPADASSLAYVLDLVVEAEKVAPDH